MSHRENQSTSELPLSCQSYPSSRPLSHRASHTGRPGSPSDRTAARHRVTPGREPRDRVPSGSRTPARRCCRDASAISRCRAPAAGCAQEGSAMVGASTVRTPALRGMGGRAFQGGFVLASRGRSNPVGPIRDGSRRASVPSTAARAAPGPNARPTLTTNTQATETTKAKTRATWTWPRRSPAPSSRVMQATPCFGLDESSGDEQRGHPGDEREEGVSVQGVERLCRR